MEDYRGSNCICTGEAAEKLYRMQGKAEQKRREEADADHEAECIQPADESEADDNGSGRKRHGKRRLAEECGFRQHGNCEGIRGQRGRYVQADGAEEGRQRDADDYPEERTEQKGKSNRKNHNHQNDKDHGTDQGDYESQSKGDADADPDTDYVSGEDYVCNP